jgi:hypothetical protein|tara:strand:- start:635 stop:757 length:123 start_codon:yes stop_codon:yes gene_type:complete
MPLGVVDKDFVRIIQVRHDRRAFLRIIAVGVMELGERAVC